MKKFTFCLMTAFIFLVLTSSQFKTETNSNRSTTFLGISKTIESGDANAEISPLNELNSLDLSELSQSEKSQYSSDSSNNHYSQQMSESASFSDGGSLIVLIMLVYMY